MAKKKIMRIDLLQHFTFGTLIAFFVINSFVNIGVWYGFAICVAIAAGKEVIWDKLMKKGTFDWLDMAYTIVPAVLILLTILNR